MTVVTRFAPSPTGFLHIGGARTALFNWLYARHEGGRFLIRIEDTDRARSTEAAVAAIIGGLEWLGLHWDGDAVFQSQRLDRHVAVAEELLAAGKAYHCYASADELAEMRAEAQRQRRTVRYDGRWRDRDAALAPPGVAPVIRFKAPREGDTVIADRVQGDVRIANTELDDMVLLRADRTPTYMLSVVVDDHDMGISHVIRGTDHLNNAARQTNLFAALGWEVPTFAHVPLIHGADGARLSKRHGALGVETYRDDGYLPEALNNYLLRLGWSHGDDEIIATEQAITWFDLGAVGRSPARFDKARLDSLNAHYLRAADERRIVEMAVPYLEATLGHPLAEPARARLLGAVPEVKQRVSNIVDLAESMRFYVIDGFPDLTDKARRLLDAEALGRLARLKDRLAALEAWDIDSLEAEVRAFAGTEHLKLGEIAQPLRAALTGRTASPPIFDVLTVLGRETALFRLSRADIT